MLIEAIAFFLGTSLLLYFLFGGADFGAGILEAFKGRKLAKEQQDLITHAMGPVWEANHVWLILAVVILFVAFPQAYTLLSVAFHIPLTLMLVGVVLRGCAFTFRHYDAVQDDSQKVYSAVFVVSSFLTPFMIGTIAGGVLLGELSLEPISFWQNYVSPWANVFSFSVGVWTCLLFAFLAAVYLVGESNKPELRRLFIRRAQWFNALAMIWGLVVFAAAMARDFPLVEKFTQNIISMGSMALATLLLVPLWFSLAQRRVMLARVLVAMQVGLVLIGLFGLQFPVLVPYRSGALTIYNGSAPEPTLKFLLYALITGCALIFPALIYLLRIFKRTVTDQSSHPKGP